MMTTVKHEASVLTAVNSIERSMRYLAKLEAAKVLYENGELSKDDYDSFCKDVLSFKPIRMY